MFHPKLPENSQRLALKRRQDLQKTFVEEEGKQGYSAAVESPSSEHYYGELLFRADPCCSGLPYYN